MARAHAAWLAAVRLGMSGQVVETYPLVRMVVENSWYALHLAKDSAPPARAGVWPLMTGDWSSMLKRRFMDLLDVPVWPPVWRTPSDAWG